MEVLEGEAARLRALHVLIDRHIDHSVMDVESRRIWLALPTTLHCVGNAQNVWRVLESAYRDAQDRPRRQFRLLECVDRWLVVGPHLDDLLLREVQSFVQSIDESMQRTSALATLAALRNFSSPVIGRWRLKSPRETPLQVVHWAPGDVATALTALCDAFFRLRCSEFGEHVVDGERKHLRELSLKFNATCCYVTLTVLVGAHTDKEMAVKLVKHWLAIAQHLVQLRNFHMAFAVQAGLAKHQLDRLQWLWKGLNRKSNRARDELNKMFDQTKRMEGATDAYAAAVAAGTPCVPVIFWYVQKALLLAETPLLNADMTLNETRIVASGNIFNSMIDAQAHPYGAMGAHEEIVWFFQALERGVLVSFDDEMLYSLSNTVKNGPADADAAVLHLITRPRPSQDMDDAQLPQAGSTSSP